MQRRLKTAQLPAARAALLVKQGHKCPLCQRKITASMAALDHDHKTGYIRDVLCRNCNGMEGKVFNRATRAKAKLTELQWLKNLVAYHEKHQTPKNGAWLHPTHKTEAEKRLAKNKKARLRRAKLKAQKEQ